MESEQSSSNQNLMETGGQQQISPSNTKLFVAVTVSVLLAATVVGLTVYFWQRSVNESTINSLEQKISSLEEQISSIKNADITPQATLSPKPDTTANWKTYQNEDITFKFPSLWTEKPILIRGSGFTQEFEDPKGKFSFTFSKTGNYNQVTGKPYVSLDEYINMPYKVKVVTIDGIEGRQPLPRAGSENVNSVVFFSKDSKFIYTLELQTGSTAFENTPSDASEADIEEGEKLFDQILSTFKFTKETENFICQSNTDCVIKEGQCSPNCFHKDQEPKIDSDIVCEYRPWFKQERCECINSKCTKISCEDLGLDYPKCNQ